MLFNSFTFALFLPLVFLLHWYVFSGNHKRQNLILLISSYLFYGWWDYRFLSLIVISSLSDYIIALKLGQTSKPQHRKILLGASLLVNLGILGFFKYYNFFIDTVVESFGHFGIQVNLYSLYVILPVGISFYTFQTLSYTLDVYRRTISPTKDLLSFMAYVSFFPQLVAGPIERASTLLPQFKKARAFEFEKGKEGIKLVIWGLFKKVVIADQCAIFVNEIFAAPGEYPGSMLFLGAIFFAFQIYGDFSGYSDVAIGTAKLFGIDLMRNFRYPYFARDIAEFWRRWHISLSSWFRDYLYIPLGGSRVGTLGRIRNVIIIFTVSGAWHGANWTFIVWGFLHGLYYIPLLLSQSTRVHLDEVGHQRLLPSGKEFLQMVATFLLVSFAFIFFRSESLYSAGFFIKAMVSFDSWAFPGWRMLYMLGWIVLLVAIEWLNRDKLHPFNFDHRPFFMKYCIYGMVSYLIVAFSYNGQQFIYFQF